MCKAFITFCVTDISTVLRGLVLVLCLHVCVLSECSVHWTRPHGVMRLVCSVSCAVTFSPLRCSMAHQHKGIFVIASLLEGRQPWPTLPSPSLHLSLPLHCLVFTQAESLCAAAVRSADCPVVQTCLSKPPRCCAEGGKTEPPKKAALSPPTQRERGSQVRRLDRNTWHASSVDHATPTAHPNLNSNCTPLAPQKDPLHLQCTLT